MEPIESVGHSQSKLQAVLLTGVSGYVGGRLLKLLEKEPVVLRCLARNTAKIQDLVAKSTEVVQGDVMDA